jgi:hypothetical protein
MRRSFVAVVAAAVLALLAGCAAVPTSGPVQFAPVDERPRSGNSISRAPDGPRAGDKPELILEGFISAMAIYQPDYAVVRQFLVPSLRSTWHPSQVRVYESGEPKPFDAKTGQISVEWHWRGAVGADGGWTPAKRDEKSSHAFKFVLVDGEWRIANPPPFVVMSDSSFGSAYNPYDLYFWDPTNDHLVPDPIYLPDGSNIVTLLVQGLLDGPTTWMRPALRTAFPAGTRLAAQSVPVADNVATIDLTGGVRELPVKERNRMATQLAWTLTQGTQLTGMEIQADHDHLLVDDDLERFELGQREGPDPPGVSSSAFAIEKDRVVQVVTNSSKLGPVIGPLGREPVRSVAVSLLRVLDAGDGRREDAMSVDRLAAVSLDGQRVLVDSQPFVSSGADDAPDQIYVGENVLEPSWDRDGMVWLVDKRREGTRLLAVDPVSMKPKQVDTQRTLLTGDVRSFKVSRDGVHVAALVHLDGRNRLVTGWINRAGSLSIRGVRELPLELESIGDLSWTSVDEVIVVGRDRTDVPVVWRVGMDGQRIVPKDPPNTAQPSTVAAAPNLPLLIGAADGTLFQEDPSLQWELFGNGRAPVYPG